MTFLEILPRIVAFLAIAWTIRQVLQIRDGVLSGKIMIPASLSGLLVFVVCESIVFISGFSALHLLWLWPLSVVLGFGLLFFPLTMPVLMFCMILLRLTGKSTYDDVEEIYREMEAEDFDEEGGMEIIDVDFQSHTHSRRKSEKQRKKKRRKK